VSGGSGAAGVCRDSQHHARTRAPLSFSRAALHPPTQQAAHGTPDDAPISAPPRRLCAWLAGRQRAPRACRSLARRPFVTSVRAIAGDVALLGGHVTCRRHVCVEEGACVWRGVCKRLAAVRRWRWCARSRGGSLCVIEVFDAVWRRRKRGRRGADGGPARLRGLVYGFECSGAKLLRAICSRVSKCLL
jgi:hypothetical protein